MIPAEVHTKVVSYKQREVQVVAARDLTERKQMEAQQRRLAALEERERIGREFHGDLGQVMGYVNVESQSVRTMLEQGKTSQAKAALARLAQVARNAHGDIRAHIRRQARQRGYCTGTFHVSRRRDTGHHRG